MQTLDVDLVFFGTTGDPVGFSAPGPQFEERGCSQCPGRSGDASGGSISFCGEDLWTASGTQSPSS